MDLQQAADLATRLQAGQTFDHPDPAFALLDDDRFGRGVLGLTWDSLAAERFVAHVDVDERHRQPFGAVHGGVWCGIVESVASVAATLHVAPSRRIAVGVSNSTDFFRPHRSGRVVAVGTPVHVGHAQQLWQVELRRATDAGLVARGQVRLQNVKPAPSAPGRDGPVDA